jgi:hypothetical protein
MLRADVISHAADRQVSACKKPFSERAPRLRDGYQMQCPRCVKPIAFDSSSEDPKIRRPLKAAGDSITPCGSRTLNAVFEVPHRASAPLRCSRKNHTKLST